MPTAGKTGSGLCSPTGAAGFEHSGFTNRNWYGSPREGEQGLSPDPVSNALSDPVGSGKLPHEGGNGADKFRLSKNSAQRVRLFQIEYVQLSIMFLGPLPLKYTGPALVGEWERLFW